jgi:hypothetical protein
MFIAYLHLPPYKGFDSECLRRLVQLAHRDVGVATDGRQIGMA